MLENCFQRTIGQAQQGSHLGDLQRMMPVSVFLVYRSQEKIAKHAFLVFNVYQNHNITVK